MTRTRRVVALAAAVATSCMLTTAAAGAASSGVVSTGHSGWGWGTPAPQGQSLAAVAFQGADGYAVGALGTILRSDDAGQTWTGLASGTIDDLDLVQELTPTTVIAAGGCAAVESTDGGTSFTSLPLGLGAACEDPVAGIAFTDPAHGFIELRDGTLLYTADGGTTLQGKSAPPLGGGHATGLAFSSPTTGLAVSSGGLIEQTTDGGNSWTQVLAAPQPLNSVTIVSPTLAYAVGNAGELERSTDGGASWTQLPLALQGGGTVPDLSSITCADAEDCLIATEDSNELVRTTDGGQTGAVVSVSNDALSGVAYATGSTVVGVGAEGATVISGDSGQTFPTVSSDPLAGFDPYVGLRRGLARGSAYLTGTDGEIAATTDSGRSWSLVRVPTSRPIMSVAFASGDVGYALDRAGVLRRTTDGGQSWHSFSQTRSFSSTLITPTADSVLLVGPTGVRRSTNGGASFREVAGRERVRHGRGARVSSLPLQNAVSHGKLVLGWGGPKGQIAVSSDGGRIWRSVPQPPGGRNSALYVGDAVSRSRLWFLDSRGLWSTSDGGRRWHQQASLGEPLGEHGLGYDEALSFSSKRDGLVSLQTPPASASGPLEQVNVLQTTDGGRTWTPEILDGWESAPGLIGLLSAPSGDIDALSPSVSGNASTNYNALFTTAGVPAPARHTKLSIRFAMRRMSARALARAHHRVLVTGHLSPVLSQGETVAVTTQSRPRARWGYHQVRVASNGSFRLRLSGVRGGARVVAQAVGTSAVSGAGTPAARLTVRR